jgi:glycosyltransferase involved in cell wall biosynthesis
VSAARRNEPKGDVTTICLVTTGQPASNPRLVKEADALVEAGFRVHVVGAHWARWADRADMAVRHGRPWSVELIEWRRDQRPLRFWKTRLRHAGARALLAWPVVGSWMLRPAVGRLTPELTRAASRMPASLYVAHNLGALPAAVTAARRHGGRVGFDAEDFHGGGFPADEVSSHRRAVEWTERRFIPLCDYLTAASPGIAEAYAPLARAGHPVCVLNVFPLDQRPPRRGSSSVRDPLRLYWFSQTIGPDRGLEDVVRAMGRLDDGSVELHLRGAWQEGYRDSLLRLAEQSGVRGAWLVDHEPGAPGEMARLASACDVGLALEPGATPNSDIALSNKIFTYLLAGLAVVASRTRGQEPLIREMGDALWGYQPGDIDALAERLMLLVSDRTALDAARGRAWHYGETRYNWDREKARLVDTVTAVVPAPRPPATVAEPGAAAEPMRTAG